MSFDGSWAIVIATPMGKQDVRLDITDNTGAIAGTATQGIETVTFIDPVADGNRIRWSQKITKPMSMMIKFDLIRDGDAIAGTAKPGILPSVKVTGKRHI